MELAIKKAKEVGVAWVTCVGESWWYVQDRFVYLSSTQPHHVHPVIGEGGGGCSLSVKYFCDCLKGT